MVAEWEQIENPVRRTLVKVKDFGYVLDQNHGEVSRIAGWGGVGLGVRRDPGLAGVCGGIARVSG
jgi:hypothetical protein